ncbi:MAG: cytochrome c oxidase assembly protein [Acidimicrobiales bacterium]
MVPDPSQLLGVVASPPVHAWRLLSGWQVEPLALASLAVLVVVGAAYLRAVRRLTRRGRSWSGWRVASFLGGLAVVVVAVDSGVASYDDSVFTVHVVQHLLLMSLAPPLLALGAPVTLALQTTSRTTKTVLLRVLHSWPVRILSNPGVAFALAMGTMYVYFLSPVYVLSVEHPLFHDYAHLHFLVAGCLFWWPIVSEDPMPRQLGYAARMGMLGLAVPFNAFLGVAIMNMSSPIASVHTLADTHAGGAILWASNELFTLGALAVLFARWSRSEERLAAREDRRAAAGVPSAAQPGRRPSLAREQAMRRRAVIPAALTPATRMPATPTPARTPDTPGGTEPLPGEG